MEINKDQIAEILLKLACNSAVQPAFLHSSDYIDKLLSVEVIDEDEAEELNDDDKKDMILLAYLYDKGILSIDILKEIFNQQSYKIYNISKNLKKIAQDKLGIIFT